MRAGYQLSIENGAENFTEIEPLYRTHYGEMQARLAKDGISVADFDMRLDVYMERWRAGHLINYIARKDGAPVGYCNIYVTNDMHNGERIAVEDAIYVLPEHRDGTGRLLAKFVLSDLEERGVKRLNVAAVTDPRAALLWQRLGFRPTGQLMTYTFEKD
jgi:L-amino acid N-acyltransferase YncA